MSPFYTLGTGLQEHLCPHGLRHAPFSDGETDAYMNAVISPLSLGEGTSPLCQRPASGPSWVLVILGWAGAGLSLRDSLPEEIAEFLGPGPLTSQLLCSQACPVPRLRTSLRSLGGRECRGGGVCLRLPFQPLSLQVGSPRHKRHKKPSGRGHRGAAGSAPLPALPVMVRYLQ